MSDREELLAALDAGRGELLAAVEGMTDEQAAARPPGGGWSALECLEHAAIAEEVLLQIQTQSVAVEEEMSRAREARLYQLATARGRKFPAPDIALPTGRYATPGEAAGAFLHARERTVQWLATSDFDLRRRCAQHPVLGAASVYEMVLLMAAHPARHARQIREARGQ